MLCLHNTTFVTILRHYQSSPHRKVCVCVCVCEGERECEREREKVCEGREGGRECVGG